MLFIHLVLRQDPEELREGLEAMIEEQSNGTQGDHELEFKAWSDRLDRLDRKRGGYLDLAAEAIMDRDELRIELAEFGESREVAEEGAGGPGGPGGAHETHTAARTGS